MDSLPNWFCVKFCTGQMWKRLSDCNVCGGERPAPRWMPFACRRRFVAPYAILGDGKADPSLVLPSGLLSNQPRGKLGAVLRQQPAGCRGKRLDRRRFLSSASQQTGEVLSASPLHFSLASDILLPDSVRAMGPEQISRIAMHTEVGRIDAGNRHWHARVDATDALDEHRPPWRS
jgi:hypothetical protein